MASIYSQPYQEMIDLLKKVREKQNLTQRALAKRLNVGQPYISKIENYELKLDIIDYFIYAKELNIDLELIIQILERNDLVCKVPK